MPIPYFFSIFLIFIGWFAIKRAQAAKKERESKEAFWKKEEEANVTRRKDLSTLSYVKIPYERLPFGLISSPEIKEQEDTLRSLSGQDILNLSGISNTDLKLTYGAANLPVLSECDERFTILCIALNQWGLLLNEATQEDAARQVFEFAVSAGSDIGVTYTTLATIYLNQNKAHLIPELIKQAERLNTLSKKTIILKLSEFVHK